MLPIGTTQGPNGSSGATPSVVQQEKIPDYEAILTKISSEMEIAAAEEEEEEEAKVLIEFEGEDTPEPEGQVEADTFSERSPQKKKTAIDERFVGILGQNLQASLDYNLINLGTPRDGTIRWDFNQEEKTTEAHKIIQAKRYTNIARGSSSLIGQVAQIIESQLHLRRERPKKDQGDPIRFGGMTFKFARNSDIVVVVPNNACRGGKYRDIVQSIIDSGEANHEQLKQLLTNLSKGCVRPAGGSDEQKQFDLANFTTDDTKKTLEEKLFEGLQEKTKILMAVFICECIRFNDDGALVRYATRLIEDVKKKGSYGEAYKVVLGLPDGASFAQTGGKSQTNAAMETPKKGNSSKAYSKMTKLKVEIRKQWQQGSHLISPAPKDLGQTGGEVTHGLGSMRRLNLSDADDSSVHSCSTSNFSP